MDDKLECILNDENQNYPFVNKKNILKQTTNSNKNFTNSMPSTERLCL